MAKKSIYRISFINDETIYEIYAKQVSESQMFGFLEIEEFVFGENTSVVVDPSEERLKQDFSGVKRTFIPMHAVIRIDEVVKEGTVKIKDLGSSKTNISHFPNRASMKSERSPDKK